MLRSLILNKTILEQIGMIPNTAKFTEEEWKWMEQMLHLMHMVETALLSVECTSSPSINKVFPILMQLRTLIKEDRSINSQYFSDFSRLLEQYFFISENVVDTCDNCSLIIACAYLDPRTHEFLFAPEDWREELVSTAEAFIRSNVQYQTTTTEITTSSPRKNVRERLLGAIYSKKPATGLDEEILKYKLVTDVEQEPLEWWMNHAQQYPILSSIARDFLAIPASSAGSERVFSTTKNIATHLRSSLTPENFSKLAFISCNKEIVDF